MEQIQLFDSEHFNKTGSFDSPNFWKKAGRLNWDTFIQHFVEKLPRCFCSDNLKKNLTKIRMDLKRNLQYLCILNFHNPTHGLSVYLQIFLSSKTLLMAQGCFSTLYRMKKRSIIHGKAIVFTFCYKDITFALKKQTNRAIYTNRRKKKAIRYMPLLLSKPGKISK